jgi:ABC-2 type transport system permease protein
MTTTFAVTSPRAMTLWRVERLRLVRSHRWVAVVVAFALCGVAGPLLAEYAGHLFAGAAGSGIQVVTPTPVPADGIAGFTRSALQLGALVVVVVAASASCVDAHPAVAVFYRTRTRRAADLVVPRAVVTVATAVGGYALGLAVAWYETVVLLGAPDAPHVLVGAACAVLYLSFLVVVTAVCSAAGAGVALAAGAGVAVSLLLPVLGAVSALAPWLPSRLTSAQDDLLRGAAFGDLWRSVAVTAALVAVLVVAAVVLSGRRQPVENGRL